MSPKSFEYSRYDDHEIQAILRDTEHRPNRLIVFLSWELNRAKRNKTALRVDDEMYYFADSASAPEIDPGPRIPPTPQVGRAEPGLGSRRSPPDAHEYLSIWCLF